MNKAMLVDRMSDLTEFSKSTCKKCLEAFIEAVGKALKQEKQVVLTGFGTFRVTKRKSRTGVNPATKQKMTIPAKRVATFRPGKALKERI